MALWTPNDWASAKQGGWWDIADAATVTQSGGVISAVTDKSTRGANLVASGSERPGYSANAFGTGKPGATVNGSQGLYKASGYGVSNKQINVWIIAKNDSGNTNGSYARLASFASSTGNDYDSSGVGPILGGSAGANSICYFQDGDSAAQNFANDTMVLLEGYATSTTTGTPAVNGVIGSGVRSSSTLGTTTLDKLCIGGFVNNVGGGYGWKGAWCKAVVFLGVPTTDDIERVEGFLSWDVAGDGSLLPTGHTYKTAAPTTSGGTASATGSAAGVATASGVSSAPKVATGSVAGAAATSGASSAPKVASGSAAGAATTGGVGAARTTGVGSASGAATTAGVGSARATGTGSAAGAATTSGISSATAKADGAVAGIGSVSGSTAAAKVAAGGSVGLATVSGVGSSVASGQSTGTAAGAATTAGVSSARALAVGTSAGVAVVSGSATSTTTTAGSASGVATVSGVGSSIAGGQSAGVAAGTAIVSGISSIAVRATGAASGSAAVVGFTIISSPSVTADPARTLINFVPRVRIVAGQAGTRGLSGLASRIRGLP